MQRFVSHHIFGFSLAAFLWVLVSAVLFYSGAWPGLFQQLKLSAAWIILAGLFWIGLGAQDQLWRRTVDQTVNLSLQERVVEMMALVVPLALFWVLYGHILGHWWTYDDLDILHYVDVIGPTAGFHDPALKYNFYTPLQHFSLGMDYLLFGLEPVGYYWHHLLSMSLVLITAFYFLRRFLSAIQVSMTLGIFIVLLPTAQITNFLMVRHYVEGLIFALLSLIAFCKGIENYDRRWLILGSVFYFVSTLAKEIYVPLPALLLLLPIGSIVDRIRSSLPFIVATAVYTLLRFYMLGNEVVTGYSGQFSSWSAIAEMPKNIAAQMGWRYWWQLPLFTMVLTGIGYSLTRKPVAILITGVSLLALVLLPLFPVLGRLAIFSYYLLLFGLVFSVAVVFGIMKLSEISVLRRWQRPISVFLFLMIMLASAIPSLMEQSNIGQLVAHQRLQEQYLLGYAEPDTVVVYNHYTADDLVHFKQKLQGESGGTKWCPVSDCLCAEQYRGMASIQFDGEQWIDAGTVPQSCAAPPDRAGLNVEFTLVSPDTLKWEFGPYTPAEGSYFIASTMDEFSQHLEVPKVLPVPPQGQFRFCCSPFESAFFWTVAFKSVEGWETVSDPVRLDASVIDASGQGKVNWKASEDR